VKTLGATYVTDYEKEDIFDSLPDDSIDFVCACSRNDTVYPPSSKSDASDGGVGGGVGGAQTTTTAPLSANSNSPPLLLER
jgi:hypothetical protein